MATQTIQIIDSHTGGEPTRVIISGGPDLGVGPLEERCAKFAREFDRYRSATVNEPRGSDVMVGALLVEPEDATCAAGVIFFNNVGYLGMCGHGTIGLIATLAHLGRIVAGEHRIETPVGVVSATLHPDGSVSVANVPSWRSAKGVSIEVPGIGQVTGDIAWGGNWFFIVNDHGQSLELANVAALTSYASAVRAALNAGGHSEVDHIELSSPSPTPGVGARNFMLCPGGAYDRSPCGTGTSAKLACLAADGKLAEGAEWIQESVIGSTFSAAYRWVDQASGKIVPVVRGIAYINSEATLCLNQSDPFCWGIR